MFTLRELGQTIGYRYYNLLASFAKSYNPQRTQLGFTGL